MAKKAKGKKTIVFGIDIIPRRAWYRKPVTQTAPNKKAAYLKYACRKI